MDLTEYHANCYRQALDLPLAGSDDTDAVPPPPLTDEELARLDAEFPPAPVATPEQARVFADALRAALYQSLPHYMEV